MRDTLRAAEVELEVEEAEVEVEVEVEVDNRRPSWQHHHDGTIQLG
jgi:hypothetical protein